MSAGAESGGKVGAGVWVDMRTGAALIAVEVVGVAGLFTIAVLQEAKRTVGKQRVVRMARSTMRLFIRS